MIRRPAVAGMFYPAREKELVKLLDAYIDKKKPKQDVLGMLSPHAGYVYSGPVAGAVFSVVNITKTLVIIGPNHTGAGEVFGIMSEGKWSTPLGEVLIDERLAKAILENCRYIREDERAHCEEHSLEVQVPFIQYLRRDAKIVPLVVSQADADIYKQVGRDIANAIKRGGEDTIVIASSDMTHYEPHESANKKDKQAIEAILKLDEELLMKRIWQMDISMCGWAPCVIMMSCVKELGAKSAQLIKYQTSGEVSGDYSAVVGYAGMVITRS